MLVPAKLTACDRIQHYNFSQKRSSDFIFIRHGTCIGNHFTPMWGLRFSWRWRYHCCSSGLLGRMDSQVWIWWLYVSPKCWYLCMSPHSILTQENNIDAFCLAPKMCLICPSLNLEMCIYMHNIFRLLSFTLKCTYIK
jgi:hypothetical protein